MLPPRVVKLFVKFCAKEAIALRTMMCTRILQRFVLFDIQDFRLLLCEWLVCRLGSLPTFSNCCVFTARTVNTRIVASSFYVLVRYRRFFVTAEVSLVSSSKLCLGCLILVERLVLRWIDILLHVYNSSQGRVWIYRAPSDVSVLTLQGD